MTELVTSVRPFGWRDRFGYAFGDAANDFTFIMVTTYFMLYATNVAGINAFDLAWVMLAARLADAFYDLWIGHLVDTRPQTPAGRFRPWIPRVAPFVVLTGALCFAPFTAHWDYAARLTWASVAYFVYGLVFSTIAIPYGSMAAVVSPDPVHRSSLSVFRSMGALVAILAVVTIPPQLIYAGSPGKTFLDGNRLFAVAIVGGVIALALYAVCYRWVRERIVAPPSDHLGLLSAVVSAVKNPALAALVVAALVQGLAVGINTALVPYVTLEYFGEGGLQSLAGMAIVLPTVIFAPLATRLGRRFGKKELIAAGTTISALAGFGLAIAQTKDPTVYLIGLGLAGLGQGLFALLIWALIVDVIDSHQLRTGERDDGVIFATYSWSRKVSQALSSFLGSWVLGYLGYKSSTSGQQVQQSPETVKGLYMFSALATGVLFAALTAILVWWYPLHRERVFANSAALSHEQSA